MTASNTGRMLLSHNFNVSTAVLPSLTREGFTQVFAHQFQNYPDVKCRQLNHPHWMVEILFPLTEFSPDQVGEICAQALVEQRISTVKDETQRPDVLILGGCKKTPPMSEAPETLQRGEWGVDVVDTASASDFLAEIAWESKTEGKTLNEVFKIERRGRNTNDE